MGTAHFLASFGCLAGERLQPISHLSSLSLRPKQAASGAAGARNAPKVVRCFSGIGGLIFITMKRIGNGRTVRCHGRKLVCEVRNGFTYEYYALGKHVVIAPGVCGGRPTFKGTRVEVQTILDALRRGESIAEILKGYPGVPRTAIREAIQLAGQALTEHYALAAA